jgi:ATP-binding cassette subfamily B (MDR/TAP) protein 8
MPILYIFMNMYGSYLRKLSRNANYTESIANGIAGEAVSNIRTVRSFVAEDAEIERYSYAVSASSMAASNLGFHIGY